MSKESVFSKVEKVTYLTPASTVVLVSTKGLDGVNNIAPFGMFMMASTRPPMVIVGVSPKTDTHKNIFDTKEFVVGIPTRNIVNEVYASGENFPPEVDEFIQVGLTPYKSPNIKAPRIHECIVNLDCMLAWTQTAGNHTIICGNVIDADLDDNIFTDSISSIELRKKVSELYHITSNAFLTYDGVLLAKKTIK
jgi:flavin reductase (DIM6/NTAB) family NADH-FMN oxidoreductase RutF